MITTAFILLFLAYGFRGLGTQMRRAEANLPDRASRNIARFWFATSWTLAGAGALILAAALA